MTIENTRSHVWACANNQAVPEVLPSLESPDRVLAEVWAVDVVEDNGPGIPEDVLPRIIEPLFTTKAPGQGTEPGLSVSYCIIAKSHGGWMCVE